MARTKTGIHCDRSFPYDRLAMAQRSARKRTGQEIKAVTRTPKTAVVGRRIPKKKELIPAKRKKVPVDDGLLATRQLQELLGDILDCLGVSA
jgi:hypothetical protein